MMWGPIEDFRRRHRSCWRAGRRLAWFLVFPGTLMSDAVVLVIRRRWHPPLWAHVILAGWFTIVLWGTIASYGAAALSGTASGSSWPPSEASSRPAFPLGTANASRHQYRGPSQARSRHRRRRGRRRGSPPAAVGVQQAAATGPVFTASVELHHDLLSALGAIATACRIFSVAVLVAAHSVLGCCLRWPQVFGSLAVAIGLGALFSA